MDRNDKGFRVVFPRGTEEQERVRMRERGNLALYVHGEDGSRYNATFITPEYAAKTMADAKEKGQPCLADINLFIVPEITVENIEASVEFLWKEGFFRRYAMPYRPTLKRICAMISSYTLFFRD